MGRKPNPLDNRDANWTSVAYAGSKYVRLGSSAPTDAVIVLGEMEDQPQLLADLRDANLIDFRFPVQRVVRPDQNFRGYAGAVASGVARVGDEVVVLPAGKRNSS